MWKPVVACRQEEKGENEGDRVGGLVVAPSVSPVPLFVMVWPEVSPARTRMNIRGSMMTH